MPRDSAVYPPSAVALALSLILTLALALAFALSPVAAAAAEPDSQPWRPELMPRGEEIAEALAAGPASIREQAGVYVLTDTGYELVRESANGFHCLVGRGGPEEFEPMCFDAEGSATLLHEVLLAAGLRMAGRTRAEIDAAVAEAWAEGELRAPRRPGINYMLSKRNRVPVDDQGTVRPYRPHLMFYVPYLTNADLGVAGPGPGSPLFVIKEGTPGAYAIVPVPQE
jgi:hypothetical protein